MSVYLSVCCLSAYTSQNTPELHQILCYIPIFYLFRFLFTVILSHVLQAVTAVCHSLLKLYLIWFDPKTVVIDEKVVRISSSRGTKYKLI